MPKDDDEFSFLDIDPFRLDEEWRDQPKLYSKWARRLANARRDQEQAKANLDLVRAELDIAIREDPSQYDIPKATENAIGNVILTQREYKDAQRDLIKAKHRVDILSGHVVALDHRKRALENSVTLMLADYYSNPKVKVKGTKALEKMDEIGRKRAFRSIPAERAQRLIEMEDVDG